MDIALRRLLDFEMFAACPLETFRRWAAWRNAIKPSPRVSEESLLMSSIPIVYVVYCHCRSDP